VGQRIADVRGRSEIVTVRGVDGTLDAAPAVDRIIAAGDMLVAVGTPETLDGLEALFQPREGVGE
jgi:voltage-gated potassium channel